MMTVSCSTYGVWKFSKHPYSNDLCVVKVEMFLESSFGDLVSASETHNAVLLQSNSTGISINANFDNTLETITSIDCGFVIFDGSSLTLTSSSFDGQTNSVNLNNGNDDIFYKWEGVCLFPKS